MAALNAAFLPGVVEAVAEVSASLLCSGSCCALRLRLPEYDPVGSTGVGLALATSRTLRMAALNAAFLPEGAEAEEKVSASASSVSSFSASSLASS